MLSAPRIQVAHFCTVTMKAWPTPETAMVQATKIAMQTRASTGTDIASGGVPKSGADRESTANATVVVLTVRQPRREGSEASGGPMLARTPKVARDRVRLGAPPRRPAIEITPTIAKEPNAPMTAA